MAKKSSNSLYSIVAIALCAVTIVLFLLPFVNYSATLGSSKITSAISGFALAFGGTADIITKVGSVSTTASGDVKLVAITLVSFILVVLGLCGGLVNLLAKTKFVKIIRLCTIVLLVVAAVLTFTTLAGFKATNELNDTAMKAYSMGFGAIAVGIVSAAAAIFEVLELLKK